MARLAGDNSRPVVLIVELLVISSSSDSANALGFALAAGPGRFAIVRHIAQARV
jgi:hypothetical protein